MRRFGLGLFFIALFVFVACNGVTTIKDDNAAPVIADIANQESTVGDAVSLQLVATDEDADPLSFSASGLPNGLSVSDFGVISGAPSKADSFTVTVIVDDGQGNKPSASFAWLVNAKTDPEPDPDSEPNKAPVIQAISDQSGTVDDTVSLQIVATDPDEDPLGFSASGLPEGLTLSETGEITGSLSKKGSYTVAVSVTDDKSNKAVTGFVWLVKAKSTVDPEPETNKAPVIQPILDQENTVGESVTLQVVASDDDGDPLEFTATGLPDSLVMSTSGAITGVLTKANSFEVTVTVNDKQGNKPSATFTWLVNPNKAPSITNPGPQESIINETVNLALSASDPEGNAFSFSAAGLPDGLDISPSGVITGKPSRVDSFSVNVTVEDSLKNKAEVTFAWLIKAIPLPAEPPSFSLSASFTASPKISVQLSGVSTEGLLAVSYRLARVSSGCFDADTTFESTLALSSSQSFDISGMNYGVFLLSVTALYNDGLFQTSSKTMSQNVTVEFLDSGADYVYINDIACCSDDINLNIPLSYFDPSTDPDLFPYNAIYSLSGNTPSDKRFCTTDGRTITAKGGSSVIADKDVELSDVEDSSFSTGILDKNGGVTIYQGELSETYTTEILPDPEDPAGVPFYESDTEVRPLNYIVVNCAHSSIVCSNLNDFPR